MAFILAALAEVLCPSPLACSQLQAWLPRVGISSVVTPLIATKYVLFARACFPEGSMIVRNEKSGVYLMRTSAWRVYTGFDGEQNLCMRAYA